MTKPTGTTHISPPVARAVAVINFIARHTDQAFTLSEIARSLRLSSTTCHTLLAALTDAGYVYRTVGKTYVLGPVLSRIVEASLSPALVLHVTRPEMRALADAFDVMCSAYHPKGDRIMIFERAAAVSHIDWNTPNVTSVPLHTSMAGLFFDGGKEVGDSAPDEGSDTTEASARFDLRGFLRSHGYVVGVRTVPLESPARAKQLRNQMALTEWLTREIEPDRDYDLASIAAPVFARPGEVAFGISLTGYLEPVRGDRILTMAQALRAACDRIGAFISGRKYGLGVE